MNTQSLSTPLPIGSEQESALARPRGEAKRKASLIIMISGGLIVPRPDHESLNFGGENRQHQNSAIVNFSPMALEFRLRPLNPEGLQLELSFLAGPGVIQSATG